MKLQGLVSALVLAAAIVLPGTATASNVSLGDTLPGIDRLLPGYGDLEILHQKDSKNRNLDAGEYAFFGLHAAGTHGFFDDWSFTLDQNSGISISLLDIEIPLPGSVQGYSNLFDSKYLSVNLFNGAGQLLGSTGENGVLEVNNLLAGEWYTLTVSGKVNGLLGSAYFGTMLVGTEIPLGDSLPLFASALVVLALRGRKWLDRQPTAA